MTAVPGEAPDSAVSDRGRLFGIVAFSVLTALGALRIGALAGNDAIGWPAASAIVGALLVLAFNLLTIRAFLRRPAARARSGSRVAHVAAIVATCSSLVMPFALGRCAGAPLAATADVVQLVGLAWSVWALRTLGRSFSILAEARAVVDGGPYRWIRHPLYVGEVVTTAGVALHGLSVAALAVLLTLIALQAFRATREEAVLAGALPGYEGYRERTARLLPGVF